MATPKRLAMVETRSLTTVTPKWNTENIPVNILPIRDAVSDPILRFSVKLLNATVRLYRPCAVCGGNKFRNASRMGVRTWPRAVKMFFIPSMSTVRPPRSSFQPLSISLRLVPKEPRSFPKVSFTPVQRSVASLKSPIRRSNVSAQDEPIDSFMVPTSCVSVRTFVAASSDIFC